MAVTFINQKKCNNLYICTFIVDPNHFYLCDKSAFKSEMIRENEERVQNYLKNNKSGFYGSAGPEKGDFVAYLHKNNNKYIRCEVLNVTTFQLYSRYILFANDYGFQFHVNDTLNMYKLSNIFKHLPSPILKVGLDVLPATKQMNYRNFINTVQYHHKWTDDAINKFRNYFNKCIVVNFEPTMPDINHNDITFGSLMVIKESTGSAVNLGDRLIAAEMALASRDSADFWKYYSKTQSFHTEFVDDSVDINQNVPTLPSFDSFFRRAAKTLKEIRDKKINMEWTEEEKQNVKKVLSWMDRNKSYEPDIPYKDDLNEEEELFDLYVDLEEKKTTEIPHAILPARQSHHIFSKMSTINEEKKQLNKVYSQSISNSFQFQSKDIFLPGGFQIATHVCNMPKYVTDYRNNEEIFEEQAPMNTKKTEKEIDDDLEWPDSD